MPDLYVSLEKGLSEKVVEKEKALCALYSAFLPDLMSKSLSTLGAKLEEAIGKVSGLSVSHRKQLMPAHEFLGALFGLHKHGDESISASPFSNPSLTKKSLAKAAEVLQSKVMVVDVQLEQWVSQVELASYPQPLLQKLGFSDEYLKALVGEASELSTVLVDKQM